MIGFVFFICLFWNKIRPFVWCRTARTLAHVHKSFKKWKCAHNNCCEVICVLLFINYWWIAMGVSWMASVFCYRIWEWGKHAFRRQVSRCRFWAGAEVLYCLRLTATHAMCIECRAKIRQSRQGVLPWLPNAIHSTNLFICKHSCQRSWGTI